MALGKAEATAKATAAAGMVSETEAKAIETTASRLLRLRRGRRTSDDPNSETNKSS
jgi:hypothetical protein